MTEKSFFSWNRKSEHHHQVLRIRNSLGTKFQLKPTFLISCNKFAQNGNFRSKKTEKVNVIIEFCLFEILAHVINYRLHKKNSIFCTKFSQKVYLENTNIAIEFYIIQLVLVPKLSLNWRCWFFGPNLPKYGISDPKQKK